MIHWFLKYAFLRSNALDGLATDIANRDIDTTF
jgi:hypothetical protein